MANLATDPFDDTVRRVHPGHVTKDGTFIRGFAATIAARLGVAAPTEEVPAVWRGRPDAETEPFAEYPAHLVPMLPAEWFKDKIVLIGAEYTLIDRHRTPFKVVHDRDMPGIVIHAHAIAQFLDGKTARAASPLGAALTTALLAAFGMGLGVLQNQLVLR